jgi:hypothetical protein
MVNRQEGNGLLPVLDIVDSFQPLDAQLQPAATSRAGVEEHKELSPARSLQDIDPLVTSDVSKDDYVLAVLETVTLEAIPLVVEWKDQGQTGPPPAYIISKAPPFQQSYPEVKLSRGRRGRH